MFKSIFFISCFIFSHLQGLNYSIRDLGLLNTDTSAAAGINNQNTILGFVKKEQDDGNEFVDFIWQPNEEIVYLPYPYTASPILNNSNQVAGVFWCEKKPKYWFLPNTDICSKRIYIYTNGVVQDIGVPANWKMQELENWETSLCDDKELKLLSFNDHGQILVAHTKEKRFAIWQDGVFTEIDPNIISDAYEMNNHGVILARRWVKKENSNIPVLVLYNTTDQKIVEITNDINIIIKELNDNGQVIFVQKVTDCVFKGFLWDAEKGLLELDDFAPVSLNNSNQIIGFSISEYTKNDKFVPLLWTPSEVVSLNQFAGFGSPNSVWTKVTSINGINDNGYIIGRGVFDYHKHAFVLIPK